LVSVLINFLRQKLFTAGNNNVLLTKGLTMSVALQLLDVVYRYEGVGSTTKIDTPVEHIPFDRNFTFNLKRTSQTHEVAINRTGALASVPGDAFYEVKGKMTLQAGIGTSETAIGKLLKCSGFTGPTSFSSSSPATYSFSPLAAVGNIDLFAYTGKIAQDIDTNALVSKAKSVVFAPKMTFEHGKFGVVDFDGKGLAAALPAIGKYPDTENSAATISHSKYPIGLSVTVLIGGVEYMLTKLDIDFGVELALVKSMKAAFGYDSVMISNAKPVTFKASIMTADLSTITANNPFTLIDSATTSNFELTYGTVGSKVSVKSGTNKCQITDAVPGNNGGIKTLELTGIFLDNDITIAIDNQIRNK
jgi:hypothetical protein